MVKLVLLVAGTTGKGDRAAAEVLHLSGAESKLSACPLARCRPTLDGQAERQRRLQCIGANWPVSQKHHCEREASNGADSQGGELSIRHRTCDRASPPPG